MAQIGIKTSSVIKRICRNAFLFGVGDLGHETENFSDFQLNCYKIYNVALYCTYSIIIILVVGTRYYEDMPKEYRDSASSLGAAFATALFKLITLAYHKELAKRINDDMIKVCGNHEKDNLLKRQYRKVKLSVLVYFITVYLTIIMYHIHATINYFDGHPFLTVPTCWPKYSDRSTLAEVGRAFFGLLWTGIMPAMIWGDAIAIAHLIVLSFKYVTLREYFEQVRAEFDASSSESLVGRVSRLKQRLIEGTLMHAELLRIFRNISIAFGPLMSIQVLQSSGSALLLLFELAFKPEPNFITICMSSAFIVGLFANLATFMLNAGKVSHEASLLSNAIFNCGWHLSPVDRDLRRLVVLSCAQAQRPVVFRAFGLQDLSYEAYLTVAQTTYAVFAVFYRSGA